jgi:hypothetical protein
LEKVLLDFRQEGVTVAQLVIDGRDFGHTWLVWQHGGVRP